MSAIDAARRALTEKGYIIEEQEWAVTRYRRTGPDKRRRTFYLENTGLPLLAVEVADGGEVSVFCVLRRGATPEMDQYTEPGELLRVLLALNNLHDACRYIKPYLDVDGDICAICDGILPSNEDAAREQTLSLLDGVLESAAACMKTLPEGIG